MSDLISRQSALTQISIAESYWPDSTIAALSACYQRILNLPAADVEILTEDLPDGFYAVKDGVLYRVDLPYKAFENAKTVTLPPIKWEGMEEKE